MADRKRPADLAAVFEELDRTGVLAEFRKEFRGGVCRHLPQPVSLLEHRRQLLFDIDWTIGQLAAAKALMMSANTGVAPMLEFTSNNEARSFEERNRAHHRQPAYADLNLERDRARRTLLKRLHRQPALSAGAVMRGAAYEK